MRATIHQVQKKNYTWIFALVLLIVPIVVEFIWGEKLYNLTHDDIEKAPKFMYDTTKLKVDERKFAKNIVIYKIKIL